MKRIIIGVWVSICLLSCISDSSDKIQLKVRVQTSSPLTEGQQIFISGSHPYIGNWDPSKVSLEKRSDNVWEGVFLFPQDTILEFKFTKGDWNLEAVNEDGSTPDNHKVDLTSDTLIEFKISKWKDEVEIGPGTVTGDIDVIKSFELSGIKNRNVTIWLPPQYKEDSVTRYPVLYVHDGQNTFDKRRAGYNMEWTLDEVADSLIRNDIIVPFIMVAVDNDGPNRTAEYSDTELGTKYRFSVVNEIKPYIDNAYRTLSDVNNTAVLGSSMGGLVSFILTWENPDVFSKAACFSPAFVYQEYNYVDKIIKEKGTIKDIELYIDNGGIGLEKQLQPGIDQMLDFLKEEGYNYKWHLFEDHEHNENAWASRVHISLKQFYGKEKSNE